MTGRIFLSYRRDDSADATGRINDRLIREFGDDCLFMDVDGIPVGEDFARRLADEVAGCGILLAVLGTRWLNASNDSNERRLDDPNDFVRIEIGAALQRKIPVIPVLVGPATMPSPHSLPEDIRPLAFLQAMKLRRESFRSDLDLLVHELKQIRRRQRPSLLQSFAISLAAGLAGLWSGWVFHVTLADLKKNVQLVTPRTSGQLHAGLGLVIIALFVLFAHRWLVKQPLFLRMLTAGFLSMNGAFFIVMELNLNLELGLPLLFSIALAAAGTLAAFVMRPN